MIPHNKTLRFAQLRNSAVGPAELRSCGVGAVETRCHSVQLGKSATGQHPPGGWLSCRVGFFLAFGAGTGRCRALATVGGSEVSAGRLRPAPSGAGSLQAVTTPSGLGALWPLEPVPGGTGRLQLSEAGGLGGSPEPGHFRARHAKYQNPTTAGGAGVAELR